MNIPANIYDSTKSGEYNLLRACMALMSCYDQEVKPVVTVSTPGVPGQFDAFRVVENFGSAPSTKILAKMRYSPRLYAQGGDLRLAIIAATVATVPVYPGAAGSGAPANTPAATSLEQYLYDRAKDAGAIITNALDNAGVGTVTVEYTTTKTVAAILAEISGGGGVQQ